MVEQGTMTVREAGQLGGNALRDKYGQDHFRELGRLGSQSQREGLGVVNFVERLRRIAEIGGQHTKERHDSSFYSNNGKKGGAKLMEDRGSDYFAEIGRKGALSPKRKETKGTT